MRHWSWLFAAPEAREPLLGIEADVARIKLGWWGEEMGRFAQGSPVHPISRYLATLGGAAAIDWSPLALPVTAAMAQVAGAPLERAAELQSHAHALFGAPLLLAARLGGRHSPSVQTCITALAEAQYLARA